MSSLWVLGLGASVGYLMMKGQQVSSRLDASVREWELQNQVESADPSGATMREIKDARKSTEYIDQETRAFNERLPTADRDPILAAQKAREQTVQSYDQGELPPSIQGVWLENFAF